MEEPGFFKFCAAKSKFRLFRRKSGNFVCLGLLILVLASRLVPALSTKSKTSPRPCGHHGKKSSNGNECVCDPGYQGPTCEQCGGRIGLKDTEKKLGFITDGPGDYMINTKCSWLIESEGKKAIRLRFNHFATECCWDHLYIFDGDSLKAPLVAAFSGYIKDGNKSSSVEVDNYPLEVSTYSGYAFIYFYSDAVYNISGFNITYSIDSCPLNCSGHGDCQPDTASCVCNAGWKGPACQLPICSSGCMSLENQGSCDYPEQKCKCLYGYKGQDCSIPPVEASWESREVVLPQGTASFAAVLYHEDIYIVGGYHNPASTLNTDLIMSRYRFESGVWKTLVPESESIPRNRYGHAAALYNDDIFMFGGQIIGGPISDQLWTFNLGSDRWEERKSLQGSRPVPVQGHSMHLDPEGDRLIIIFGYNIELGYTNLVQEYDLNKRVWEQVNSKNILGAYGHSSTMDPLQRIVYVHGGYKYHTEASNHLYAYHCTSKTWEILKSSDEPKYLHSSVLIGSTLFVFAGNQYNHNSTTILSQKKCFSNSLFAYDTRCDTWKTVKVSPPVGKEMSRYGHAALVYRGHMVVIGGFNGHLLSDMLVFSPGQCDQIGSRDSCLASQTWLNCVWTPQPTNSDADAGKCALSRTTTPADNARALAPPCTSLISQPECGSNLASCAVCSTLPGCGWCNKTCSAKCPKVPCPDSQCGLFYNCHSCSESPWCVWVQNACLPKSPGTAAVSSKCPGVCRNHMDCQTCSTNGCVWCNSLLLPNAVWGVSSMCVDASTYVTSFPYGQCLEWVDKKQNCTEGGNPCSSLLTCTECQTHPACGWCQSTHNKGTGKCYRGGASKASPSCHTDKWYFTHCPTAGGSNCGPGDCSNGPPYKKPDKCEKCDCNLHSANCDCQTGACYCNEKGIISDKCDRCEENMKGDPKKGGHCYYELDVDVVKEVKILDHEKHYTAINMIFESRGVKAVHFHISVSSSAFFNMTKKPEQQGELLIPDMKNRQVTSSYTATIGSNNNQQHALDVIQTTEYSVCIYAFKPPFDVQVKFWYETLPGNIELLHFFVTFFSCFLSLLLIFVMGWKLKQRIDSYLRRQAQCVEMLQLGGRPFSKVDVLIYPESNRTPKIIPFTNYASPISTEPLLGDRSAVVSVLVRLPTTDEGCSVPGQSGLSIGSTLVHHNEDSRLVEITDKSVAIKRRRKQAQRHYPPPVYV